MKSQRLAASAVALALVSAVAGCATWNRMSQAERGTTVGAASGAVVGGPVGAAVGGGVGGIAGHELTKQQAPSSAR
jgi:uncharacterized membrane protein